MLRPVRILLNRVPYEVLLQADSRATAAAVVGAMGGKSADKLVVTPLVPQLFSAATGALPIVRDSVLAPDESRQPARTLASAAGTVTPGKPPLQPFQISGLQPLWRSPIPPGAGLSVSPTTDLPAAPRDLKSQVVFNPQPCDDVTPEPARIELPPPPRLWTANPATLALVVAPIVILGLIALVAANSVAVALWVLSLLAAAAEVGVAAIQNRTEWSRYEANLAQVMPRTQLALRARDVQVRETLGTVARFDKDLWGYPIENLRLPVGLAATQAPVEFRTPRTQRYRGIGRMASAPGLSGGDSSAVPGTDIAAVHPNRIARREKALLGRATQGDYRSLEVVFADSQIGNLTVIGSAAARHDILRELVLRAALRYRPEDLGIVVLSAEAPQWTWAAYLPHAAKARDWLGCEPVAPLSEEAAARLIRNTENWAQSNTSRRLLIVADGSLPAGSPLEHLEGPAWLVNGVERAEAVLPQMHQVIDLYSATFVEAAPGTGATGNTTREVTFSGCATQTASQMAGILAALSTPERSPEPLPTAANLTDWWTEARFETATQSENPAEALILSAPIGFSRQDAVSLDLNDGKNAVIVGDSTAARANVIATFLAGLALRRAPQEVNFILFDSRGTDWGELTLVQHCLGIETGPGNQVFDRLMTYLEAETKRREDWLSNCGYSSLAAARNAGKTVPAHLIIALASADTFTSRQIGDLTERLHLYRSLGLHLIMAIGDPRALPPESLRNLSNRIILDTPVEPEHPIWANFAPAKGRELFSYPGRALMLSAGVGTEIQTMNALRSVNLRDTDTAPVKFLPLGQAAFPESFASGSSSQWQRPLTVVAPRFRTGKNTGRRWLNGLDEVYDVAQLRTRPGVFSLGVQDDAADQKLVNIEFNPSQHGGLLVCGEEGAGKTTALRTLAAASLVAKIPCDLYVLAGDENLDLLENWPNVGVVAHANEPETMADTIEYLDELVRSRSAKALEVGAKDLSELRKHVDVPLTLLLIDDLEEVLEHLPASASGQLLEIISMGRQVGVHLAVSARERIAVPKSWRPAFGMRLYLRGNPPGRGLVEGDSREAQVAILGSNPDLAKQNSLLEHLGKMIQQQAQKISRLEYPVYAANLSAAPKGQMSLGFGAPAGDQINSITSGVYLVAAADAAQRENALGWLTRSVRLASNDTGLVLLAPDETKLSEIQLFDATAIGFAELDDFYHQLLSVADKTAPPGFPGLALIVVDLPEYIRNSEANAQLTKIVETVRRSGHLMFASGSPAGWQQSSALCATVKSPAQGLALGLKADEVSRIFSVSVPQDGTVFPAGRGYWIHRSSARKLQLPQESH